MDENFVVGWEQLGSLLNALGNEYGVDVVLGLCSRRDQGTEPVAIDVGVFDREGEPGIALLHVHFPVGGLSEGTAYEHMAAAALFAMAHVERNEYLWPAKLCREQADRPSDSGEGGGQ